LTVNAYNTDGKNISVHQYTDIADILKQKWWHGMNFKMATSTKH